MTGAPPCETTGPLVRLRDAYRLRWQRRHLLWRAVRSRHALAPVVDRTARTRHGDVLAFATVRNEVARLPHFLAHYRQIGVGHFLMVDNASDDGTADLLASQPDVSLWSTQTSYRHARFGADWMTWLQMRHGHGHWCVTVDADELLIYPHWPDRDLHALIRRLEEVGAGAMGALMLDLYPKGPVGAPDIVAGGDPLGCLRHFDAGPYRAARKPRDRALRVQGGVRDRVFFADAPGRAPTLNKLPLVRWNRRYAWRNSTHSILPRRLNLVWDGPGDARLSGVLLHTKFLPFIVARSQEERLRGEHFGTPGQYDAYYDALAAGPDLWCGASVEFRDWRQLVDLGLMSAGGWA